MRSLLLVLLAAIPAGAAAQEAAPFLKIGVGARALGMGGAYTALADDAGGGTWNPAGLARLPRARLDVMHAEMFGTARFDFAGFAQPTGLGTFGASARRLGQNSLEGRDASGAQTGGFSAADTAVDLAYGTAALGPLSLGAGVTFVRSAIADVSAQTYAFGFGGLYQAPALGPGEPRLGLAVENAGPGLRYVDRRWPLPLTVSAGAAYLLPSGFTFALDVRRRPNSGVTELSLGTEYRLYGGFSLRAGYSADRADATAVTPASSLGAFAGGFGFSTRKWGLDYAVTPVSDLGSVHRFSFSATF